MNLHNLVRGAISAVNPDVTVVILRSNGFVEDEAGQQVPQYLPPVSVTAQIQPLNSEERQSVERLNQSRVYRNAYLNGDWSGLKRSTEQGGDLVYWNGYEWWIDDVPEAWNPTAGWTCVRLVQQRLAEPPEVVL